MSDDRATGFSTRAIRVASRAPRVDQQPSSVPIYQTATFTSADAQALGDAAADPRGGYAYSRISNPTTSALGAAYAEVAGGEAGTALASGMAAIHAALASQLKAGDRVVAPTAIYGSTRTQLVDTFADFGVLVDFADLTDADAAAEAIAAGPTRVVYAETIANPTTVVTDHAAIAALAHAAGAHYIVDNTFASPYVCRPLELGADLVVESATKFLSGHSDVIAGVVAGSLDLVRRVDKVQIDTGATLGPFDAFLVLRGIMTVAVRLERHARTALALGTWLERQAGVERVLYPGLPSHPQHAAAMRQFRPGVAGGMLAVEVAGGRDAGPSRNGTIGTGAAREGRLGSRFSARLAAALHVGGGKRCGRARSCSSSPPAPRSPPAPAPMTIINMRAGRIRARTLMPAASGGGRASPIAAS
jgi:methionine-gamma-lyase